MLFMRISILPSSLHIFLTLSMTNSSIMPSPDRPSAEHPALRSSSTHFVTSSFSRELTKTCAPCQQSFSAIERPIPRVEPVTTAVFPFIFSISFIIITSVLRLNLIQIADGLEMEQGRRIPFFLNKQSPDQNC